MFGKPKEPVKVEELSQEQVIAAFSAVTQQQEKGQADLAAVMQSIKDLTGVVTNLTTAAQQGAQAPAAATPPTDAQPTGPSEEDMEAMSNGQLTAHIMGAVKSSITELLGDVNKSVEGVAQQQKAAGVQAQLKELGATHKDFYKWSDEIKALHARGVSTDPAVLYREARAANPEKSLELDKEFEQNGQTKDEEPDDKSDPKSRSLFGGMAPSSAGSDTGDANEFANAVEAGKAVFDESFEGLPDTLWNS